MALIAPHISLEPLSYLKRAYFGGAFLLRAIQREQIDATFLFLGGGGDRTTLIRSGGRTLVGDGGGERACAALLCARGEGEKEAERERESERVCVRESSVRAKQMMGND